ncbi:unnamed protein product [Calypogeia fissa]
MGGGPVLEDMYVPYHWPTSRFFDLPLYTTTSSPGYYGFDVQSPLVEFLSTAQDWPSYTTYSDEATAYNDQVQNKERNPRKEDKGSVTVNKASVQSEGVKVRDFQTEKVKRGEFQSEGAENDGGSQLLQSEKVEKRGDFQSEDVEKEVGFQLEGGDEKQGIMHEGSVQPAAVDKEERSQPEVLHEKEGEFQPEVVHVKKGEFQPEVVHEKKDEIQPEAVHKKEGESQPEVVHEKEGESQAEAVNDKEGESQPEVVNEKEGEFQPEAMEEEVGSDAERRAATVVQARYRGHLVRMTRPLVQLRAIAGIKAKLKRLREQAGSGAFQADLRKEKSMAKVGFDEGTLALLMELDNIQGSHPLVRHIRKSVVREIIDLQETVDTLLAAIHRIRVQ